MAADRRFSVRARAQPLKVIAVMALARFICETKRRHITTLRYVTLTHLGATISLLCVPEQSATSPPSAEYCDERVCLSVCALPKKCHGWLSSRVVSVLDSGAEGPGFKSQSRRCRVMAAYRRVYDSRHLHLQADCQEPGSAPEPHAR